MNYIALHDADIKTRKPFPNLALMKISAFHKKMGDHVEFFTALNASKYDKVYSSKVFTLTPDDPYLPKETIFGGTGNDIRLCLSEEIEHIMPDYTIYGCDKSYGFLTRGCPNKCPWCFVPEKEGGIREHSDIDEFLMHKSAVLMDNNVLASEHGLRQIEKIIKLGVKVDFNQGLDARLIDDCVARLLSKVSWLHPVRLACDSSSQIPAIQNAVSLLRRHECKPKNYFVYTLIKDVEESLDRIKFILSLGCDPFAQPYRDKLNTPPSIIQKQLARWTNIKAICKSCTFPEYKSSRGKRI